MLKKFNEFINESADKEIAVRYDLSNTQMKELFNEPISTKYYVIAFAIVDNKPTACYSTGSGSNLRDWGKDSISKKIDKSFQEVYKILKGSGIQPND